MKFFRHMLFNDLGNTDTGSAGDSGGVADIDSSDNGGSGDDWETNDDAQIGTSWSSTIKDLGLDPKKYGLDEESGPVAGDEGAEDVSHGSDKDDQGSQKTEENNWLERVNNLGAIHNEQPVKIESAEQLKELIQKGHDYTSKTQSLSEDRKAFESEKSQATEQFEKAVAEFNQTQSQLEGQIRELQQWTIALDQLKENAPDIHEEVARAFKETERHFKNPVLDQQLSAVNKRLEEAEKKLASREDKVILDSFESDWKAMAATEQSLKELGITIDKDKVKARWAETGMSPEEVVGSMYFKQIAQAKASKQKVEATQQKVAARPTGAAAASRPGSKKPAAQGKSLGQYAKDLASHYGIT